MTVAMPSLFAAALRAFLRQARPFLGWRNSRSRNRGPSVKAALTGHSIGAFHTAHHDAAFNDQPLMNMGLSRFLVATFGPLLICRPASASRRLFEIASKLEVPQQALIERRLHPEEAKKTKIYTARVVPFATRAVIRADWFCMQVMKSMTTCGNSSV